MRPGSPCYRLDNFWLCIVLDNALLVAVIDAAVGTFGGILHDQSVTGD
jgi:hypothetical protein